MLDHDDLFSSIIRNKDKKDSFQDCIKKLTRNKIFTTENIQ